MKYLPKLIIGKLHIRRSRYGKRVSRLTKNAEAWQANFAPTAGGHQAFVEKLDKKVLVWLAIGISSAFCDFKYTAI